jgi:hypothetical protein
MDSNYIAFVEKPDYSDDDIERDLAVLRNDPNGEKENKIKNKGKKN